MDQVRFGNQSMTKRRRKGERKLWLAGNRESRRDEAIISIFSSWKERKEERLMDGIFEFLLLRRYYDSFIPTGFSFLFFLHSGWIYRPAFPGIFNVVLLFYGNGNRVGREKRERA